MIAFMANIHECLCRHTFKAAVIFGSCTPMLACTLVHNPWCTQNLGSQMYCAHAVMYQECRSDH